MVNYWLVLMSEENYWYTVKNGIYGIRRACSERFKDFKAKVRPGDRLIVYVLKGKRCGDLCGSFVAILEVVSEWRESNKPTWPDEIKKNEILYPWIINVKVIINGKVTLDEIKDELSRITNRKVDNIRGIRALSMCFSRKPLPKGVGELIEEKLKKSSKGIG